MAALAEAGTAQAASAKRAGTAIRRVFMVVAPRLVVSASVPDSPGSYAGNPDRVASVRKT